MDFTRTAESVQKTGADLTKWAKQQETKVSWMYLILKISSLLKYAVELLKIVLVEVS